MWQNVHWKIKLFKTKWKFSNRAEWKCNAKFNHFLKVCHEYNIILNNSYSTLLLNKNIKCKKTLFHFIDIILKFLLAEKHTDNMAGYRFSAGQWQHWQHWQHCRFHPLDVHSAHSLSQTDNWQFSSLRGA